MKKYMKFTMFKKETENNVDLNKTIVYTYDNGGNLTSKKEYPYTTGTVGTATKTVSYGYDTAWKDKMTSYGGQTITYDKIGNPLTYRDNMSFTWQGRQMKTANLNGTSVSYKYNSDGLRSYKKVGSTVHEYEYLGDMLVYEKRGDLQFHYRYDTNGNLATLTRVNADGTTNTAYVICNSRGDVEELRTSSGALYARYIYDSWGNVLHVLNASGAEITSTTHFANQNPFRYRGYYYDIESGMYYVSSRYYDPEIGRWINADSLLNQESVLGNNMFAYCLNNPVNMTDETGNLPFFAITAAIGAVGGAIIGGVVAAKSGGNVWAGIGIGAAAGALIGTGAGMAAGAALAGSITATAGAVMAGGSALVSTVATGGLGAGATYIANNLSQAVNNAAPAVQAGATKMQQVAAKGRAGEVTSGLVKNTKHIPSLTGTASYRIQDGLTDTILAEVKNYSGTLSYTNQLKDFVLYSQSNGLEMHLYTNAHLTGPLQQAVDSGLIHVFPLK